MFKRFHWRKLGSLLVISMASNLCQAAPPKALSLAIENYAAKQGDTNTPSFRYARVDLNRDSKRDAIALLTGPGWCGSGGCTLLVLAATNQGFVVKGASSVTREPIRVAQQRSHGWASLIVHSNQGEVILAFDGSSYPENASTEPRASKTALTKARTVLR